MKRCDHTIADSWWESDGRGIPLARVCDKCYDEVMARFDPSIFEYYDQSDIDEPIEGDEW